MAQRIDISEENIVKEDVSFEPSSSISKKPKKKKPVSKYYKIVSSKKSKKKKELWSHGIDYVEIEKEFEEIKESIKKNPPSKPTIYKSSYQQRHYRNFSSEFFKLIPLTIMGVIGIMVFGTVYSGLNTAAIGETTIINTAVGTATINSGGVAASGSMALSLLGIMPMLIGGILILGLFSSIFGSIGRNLSRIANRNLFFTPHTIIGGNNNGFF